MTTEEILELLARLRVETGSLACLGCGHEHNCGIHGCQILREAVSRLKTFSTERDAAITAAKKHSCSTCKYLCRSVSICFGCINKKKCKCVSCRPGRTNWEWRGLPEAPAEGEKA